MATDGLPKLLNDKIMKWNIDESKIDIQKYDVEKNKVVNVEFNDKNYNKFCGEERVKFGEEYNKNPIVILGCSYAYGQGLKSEQTFPYLLANITKRPIYNFSKCGTHILVDIRELEIFTTEEDRKKINKADYVIYLYMHDHINRYLNINDVYVNYKYFYDFQTNKFLNYINISYYASIDDFLDCGISKQINVIYMDKIFKETYFYDEFVISPKQLYQNFTTDTIILHPLPRTKELPKYFDEFPGSKYFIQAYNGLYVRGALFLSYFMT